MKKRLSDYLVEKNFTGKNYRKYEIMKFLRFLNTDKLESITFDDFQSYLKFRSEGISYPTLKKINSVVSNFLFWVAKHNKNFKFLTQLYTDRSILLTARKKKDIKFTEK